MFFVFVPLAYRMGCALAAGLGRQEVALRRPAARVAEGDRPKGETMGDRTKRVEGKAKELKGRVKREAGAASGRRGTEARGAGDELKGKAKNAAGKARSALKKTTR